jgi:cytochrome b pre-mRNA-processing protein 3
LNGCLTKVIARSMSFLNRLLGIEPDPREALRPLWQRVIGVAREPRWYAECGVEDSVAGRFDMVTAVLALVVLRLEAAGGFEPETALLSELFVADMDGQLREFGIGDVVVGKHVGKLMGALSGRLGAYRTALGGEPGALEQAVARNVTLSQGGSAECVATGLRALTARLAGTDEAPLLAGEIAA